MYRIKTGITEAGNTVEAGYYIDKRKKLTRQTRWEQLDEEMTYSALQLDRSVVAPDQIRTVIKTFNPRFAVTVDMISTGTDIKLLEWLLFMREVKSRVYFEQMKGRGTRTISPKDLNAVTANAHAKTHFVIVDAVGVCENDKTDSQPLERRRSAGFDNLIMSVAMGDHHEDTLTSLAGRQARGLS